MEFVNHEFLSFTGFIEDVYSSIKNEDFAGSVLHALRVSRETGSLPESKTEPKSEKVSTEFREFGNKSYRYGNFTEAINCYNKALMYAPNGSQSMTFAYSNRSALLFKLKEYKACLKDIQTCFDMGCTDEIKEKLVLRKQACEKSLSEMTKDKLVEHIFKIGNRHPEIPCASTDVAVNVENEVPRVVAARDIAVGTVVAIETPHVSLLNFAGLTDTCYQCHRNALNLIPCKTCCFAMFCDDTCRNKCMKEVHSVECKLVDLYKELCVGPITRLLFKLIIKMKMQCKTWAEFIEASHCIGKGRVKKSSVNEIYDGENKFSMLAFVEHRDPKHGSMYNFAFICAGLLHFIALRVPSFFPQKPSEKADALMAMSQIMMYLFLHYPDKIEVQTVGKDKNTDDLRLVVPHYCLMAFTGKLRHDCKSNLLVLGINNQVALVANTPIKKGTELTISYIDHGYQHLYTPQTTKRLRAIYLYKYGKVCRCDICTGTLKIKKHSFLTVDQRKALQRWSSTFEKTHILARIGLSDKDCFTTTCNTLQKLQGMVGTEEHKAVYLVFLQILGTMQYAASIENTK